MELIVILIVLVALALAGVALASYSPVNTAVARADVQMSAPGAAGFFSGWSGMLFEIAFALLILVVFIVVLVKIVWPWLRKQGKPQGRWKSGPNANWGRTDEPKKMDTEKLLQMAVLSKLVGGDGGGPLILQQPEAPQEAPSQQFPEGWW